MIVLLEHKCKMCATAALNFDVDYQNIFLFL